MSHEERRTGWRIEVDEYGIEYAVSPEGDSMHILEAKRWLSDVAADLGITLTRASQQPARPATRRAEPQRQGRPSSGDWESLRPTDKQLDLLYDRLGWDGDEPPTRGEASQLIEELIERSNG